MGLAKVEIMGSCCKQKITNMTIGTATDARTLKQLGDKYMPIHMLLEKYKIKSKQSFHVKHKI